jgi:glycosyltransferase involved in cell wall biosynthesis
MEAAKRVQLGKDGGRLRGSVQGLVNKMHVTHIVAHPPFREGTGTACYYNTRALQELGCGVTVYTPNCKSVNDGGRLDFYRFMPCWLAIENAFLTPDILAVEQTDILHLHFPFIFGSELVLARVMATKIPMVVTYHNDLIGGGIRRPAFFLYNRLLAPAILRKASKIAVTSLDHAASSIYGATIFRERSSDLVEVGNGVDTDSFRSDILSNIVRSKHNLSGDELVLLFVSNLDRAHVRKGLSSLLDALSYLSDRTIKLLVAGDGEMRSHYQEQAKALGLESQVIFAGRIAHEQLPTYYAACDMVVIPSRPPESFGLALAEGMASGKPVIGCNIPGVRKVIKDGETGFLVEPGDVHSLAARIGQLAGNTDLRRSMGARGRERIIEHYTWRHVGERLRAMYENVLHDRVAVLAGDASPASESR